MHDRNDCERFMALLDRQESEDFGAEDLRRLEAHAAACPDCAALLRLRERFALGGDAELEAAVPDAMVDGMWAGVSESLAAGERVADRNRRGVRGPRDRRRDTTAPWSRLAWVQPALTAALVLLLVVTGFLFGELRGLRRTETALRERLAAQEGRLEGMAVAMATSGGRAPHDARPAGGLLGGRSYTVAELQAWLSRLPADASVLAPADLRRLEASLPERRAARLRRAIDTPALADGLQAEELLALIDALGLAPAERIDERRLDEIARSLARGRGL